MNFFKTDRIKEGLKAVSTDRLKDGLKSLTDPLKNLANNAKTALARRDVPAKNLELVEIFDRIYWMGFPRPEKIKEVSEGLQAKFDGKYFIWNVSEYQYDKDPFNNQVADFTFVGYPCPPFQEIMKVCKSILEFLGKDHEGVAIIHCQSTKCRSAVVTSCLLSLLKVVNHPMEALTYFCNRLKLDDTSFLYPSQHQILKNFANVMDKVTLNKKSFTLEKVIINEVPKLHDDKNKKALKPGEKGEGVRPYIQIFKGSKAIFNHLSKEKPKVYYTSDIAIWFEIGMEIKDEILVRCRHYKSDTERTSVFRVFFNPCFAFDEVVRLNKTEVDFLPDVETTEEFLIDLIIKPTESENNEADTIEKLREECLRLTEEYIKKKQEYDLKQEELRKEQERLEKEAQEKAAAEKAKEEAAKENNGKAKEGEANKAKFVISESASGDDEDEKDEEILKASKKESSNSDMSDEKENKEEKAAKNEKIEKLLGNMGNKEEEENQDEELEEDDLDDYISKLEGKT